MIDPLGGVALRRPPMSVKLPRIEAPPGIPPWHRARMLPALPGRPYPVPVDDSADPHFYVARVIIQRLHSQATSADKDMRDERNGS